MATLAETSSARLADGLSVELQRLLPAVRDRLRAEYRERLSDVILYGSSARGTQQLESDVDLLVLFEGELDFFRELRNLVDLLYPLQLEFDRHISAHPAAAEDFRAGKLALYRNAAREGVPL